MKPKLTLVIPVLAISSLLWLAACNLPQRTPAPPSRPAARVITTAPTATAAPTQPPAATETTSPTEAAPIQPTPAEQENYPPAGPDDYPADYNPLLGLPAAHPEQLGLPAVLLSITNFPPSARPQAGLSFSPQVFEIYISEGMTRFLVPFYGDYPGQQPAPPSGNCEPLPETPHYASEGHLLLGNKVWLDNNQNGRQDFSEPPVGGVCVTLYDATGQALKTVGTTRSHGLYYFEVQPGKTYYIAAAPPAGYTFTQPDQAEDTLDSDIDPASHRTALIPIGQADDLTWDIGLQAAAATAPPVDTTASPTETSPAAPSEALPPFISGVSVGPVRSGRLPYVYIRDMFSQSCLVYASATYEIRDLLRGCAMVYGSDQNDINSAFLDINRLRQIAEANATPGQTFNYGGNRFDPTPPNTPDQAPATEVQVYYSYLNQTRWRYDPALGEYLRYEDTGREPVQFHPATDRLTGRTLSYANVIVIFAQHDVIKPAIIDIHLEVGQKGYAYLFRDGFVQKIYWSTLADDYSKTTGKARPIRFVDATGNPIALKPGQTWIHVMTPYSYLQDQGEGNWLVRFIAPAGAAE